MKVLCIDDDLQMLGGNEPPRVSPVYGHIYTVVDYVMDVEGEFYRLLECDQDDLFETEAFVPISEIDETTFERNYEKSIA